MSTDAEAARYLESKPEKELITQANWNIIRDYIDADADSKVFNYLLNNNAAFAAKYSKDSVNSKISTVFFNALRNKIMSKDEKGYEALKTKVKAMKDVDGEKITTYTDVSFYSSQKNWNKYAEAGIAYINKYAANDDATINKIAWSIFENVTDKTLLEKAAKLSKHSVELKDNYAYGDTYANLLYKAGKIKEATKAAEHAIEMAKKENQDYSSTKELLDKIKAPKN